MHTSRDIAAAMQLLAGRRLAPSDYFASLLRPTAFAAFAADDPVPGIIDIPWRSTSVLSDSFRTASGDVAATPRIETRDSVSH